MTMSEDILYKISDEDLQLLKNLYENYKRQVPQVYGVVNSCLTWKRKFEDSICFDIFLVTGDDWLKTGTFVVIWEYTSTNVFAFTLEKDYQTLYKALLKSKRIKWNQERIWFLVPDVCIPAVNQVVQELKLPNSKCLPANIWILKKEIALQYQIEIPDNIYVEKLNKSHVDLINSYWSHNHKGSENYLSTLIERNDSYGIFMKSNNNLICWVLRNHFGLLCNLQTLPEFYGKGYGSLLVKIISNELATREHDFIGCIIIRGNDVSEKFFGRLGFHKYQACMFLESK